MQAYVHSQSAHDLIRSPRGAAGFRRLFNDMIGMNTLLIAYFLPALWCIGRALRVPASAWAEKGISRSFWIFRMALLGPLGSLLWFFHVLPTLRPASSLSSPLKLVAISLLSIAMAIFIRWIILDKPPLPESVLTTALFLSGLVVLDFAIANVRSRMLADSVRRHSV
jgi:uncharacterized membrane protein